MNQTKLIFFPSFLPIGHYQTQNAIITEQLIIDICSSATLPFVFVVYWTTLQDFWWVEELFFRFCVCFFCVVAALLLLLLLLLQLGGACTQKTAKISTVCSMHFSPTTTTAPHTQKLNWSKLSGTRRQVSFNVSRRRCCFWAAATTISCCCCCCLQYNRLIDRSIPGPSANAAASGQIITHPPSAGWLRNSAVGPTNCLFLSSWSLELKVGNKRKQRIEKTKREREKYSNGTVEYNFFVSFSYFILLFFFCLCLSVFASELNSAPKWLMERSTTTKETSKSSWRQQQQKNFPRAPKTNRRYVSLYSVLFSLLHFTSL